MWELEERPMWAEGKLRQAAELAKCHSQDERQTTMQHCACNLAAFIVCVAARRLPTCSSA